MDIVTFGNYGRLIPGRERLSATGLTQAIGTPIVAQVSQFDTVGPGGSATLPICPPGASTYHLTVLNRGTSLLLLWPPLRGEIEAFGIDVPVGIAAGTTIEAFCFGHPYRQGLHWYVNRPQLLVELIGLFEQDDLGRYVTTDIPQPINILVPHK